ncbi:hypothetical protein [Wolbachia endosymbiont (group B) of Gerris lacustris]|uniref:hypothetical protein n=1 Tax=Wolbachia endosymbiont (group B) of Gerris lacustris TaxID=3066159 RepID=UPI0033424320
MPSKPRYFTYSSMAFFPLLSIRCLYSGNWYKYLIFLPLFLTSSLNECKASLFFKYASFAFIAEVLALSNSAFKVLLGFSIAFICLAKDFT